MREILFRGKIIDSDNCHRLGEWVYGYFVNCASEYDDPEKDRVPEIIEVDADRIYAGEYGTWDVHKVALKTVTQWTGSVDKNGKKIFEGDIVAADWGYLGVVDFEAFIYSKLECIIPENIEVIGNIWDNPELVERKE